ncbi:MAG: hypothetical protein LBL82_04875 [Oscillospiraceae bacterium]|jgi:methyl-accepting chemotaxis protein|nr:hypothetical protein [Oscillospiraceae bacterium]
MDNNGKVKNTHTNRTYLFSSVILFSVVLLSVLLFVFCVIKFFAENNRIADTVLDLANNSNISNSDLIRFEAIQGYYKDTSNFQIVSLINTFIITVITGLFALHINEQKNKLDEINGKVKETTLLSDVLQKDLKNESKEITKNIDNLKGKFKKASQKSDDLQEKISEKLKEASQKSDNLQKDLELDERKITFASFANDLNTILMFASSLNAMCNTPNMQAGDVTGFTTRIRDSFRKAINSSEKLVQLQPTYEEKTGITDIIGDIEDILNFAALGENKGYPKPTQTEFGKYCDEIRGKFS